MEIEGTGSGKMNYTIGFMDEKGNYNDLRKFENISITRKTKIDTVAKRADESILHFSYPVCPQIILTGLRGIAPTYHRFHPAADVLPAGKCYDIAPWPE